MRYILILFLSILLASCSTNNTYQNRNLSSKEKPAEEYILDEDFEAYEGGNYESEKAIHDKIITSSMVMLDEMYRKKMKKRPDVAPKVHRDAHAKSHGCLHAKFEVNNEALSEEQRLGIFKKNKSYDAIMRFSNNDHLANRKDNAPDLRGVGIKVLGVRGKKVMEDKQYANTQDFLMYGSKVFFIKNNSGYTKFIERLRQGEQLNSDSEKTPFKEKAKKIWQRVKMLSKQPGPLGKTLKTQLSHKNVVNPFGMEYFSATPVRLGLKEDINKTAFKYGLYPCENIVQYNPSDKDKKHYMRENLTETLKQNENICLNFKIQTQNYPEVMPIEDSTVAWPEAPTKENEDQFSAYKTVATVNVSIKDNKELGSEKMRNLCENLSMTPWHSLVEHKPLGRTMRMRRDVYKAIAKFRRSSNGVSQEEPN